MYEYKFVKVNAKIGFSSHFEGFEEIIEEHALKGWRFVTAIPSKSHGQLGISVLSLVFEKERS